MIIKMLLPCVPIYILSVFAVGVDAKTHSLWDHFLAKTDEEKRKIAEDQGVKFLAAKEIVVP